MMEDFVDLPEVPEQPGSEETSEIERSEATSDTELEAAVVDTDASTEKAEKVEKDARWADALRRPAMPAVATKTKEAKQSSTAWADGLQRPTFPAECAQAEKADTSLLVRLGGTVTRSPQLRRTPRCWCV
jgi:hypothetical protein